jgi:hypothetical protein
VAIWYILCSFGIFSPVAPRKIWQPFRPETVSKNISAYILKEAPRLPAGIGYDEKSWFFCAGGNHRYLWLQQLVICIQNDSLIFVGFSGFERVRDAAVVDELRRQVQPQVVGSVGGADEAGSFRC